MAVTPQTNTTLAQIAEVLKEADNIVIGGHISPDGDCLGSQLCLAAILRQLGKTVTTTLAGKSSPEESLSFMPGFSDLVYAGDFKGHVDTFVAVDVPTHDRMGEAQWALHEKAKLTITIDHHAVDSCMAKFSYTDPASASTTLLIWEIGKLLDADLSAGPAVCAYTGLLTDTGCFRNQNTDNVAFAGAMEMVAAGVVPGDVARDVFQNRTIASVRLQGLVVDRMRFAVNDQFLVSWLKLEDFDRFSADATDADTMVDILRSITGVRVVCMLKECKGEHGVFVKGSFRAKDDTDVAAVARRHNGGGHKAAAGFKMFCPIEQAMLQLCDEFADVLE